MPAIGLAVALSLALHALLLFAWLPRFEPVRLDTASRQAPRAGLVVQLEPGRRAAPTPSAGQPVPRAAPPPPRRGLPEKARARPPSPPRAVPFNRPTPYVPAPPEQPPAATPPDGDLAAYIEARRRARGETDPRAALSREIAPPQQEESEEERRRRIVAANLGLDRAPAFVANPRAGGGIFQITRMGYTDAEFVFFGWNKNIGRNSRQRIGVVRGDSPDIEIAVIRRMIAIIREHEQGDFTWVSQRLGRDVTLSARTADSAGLEDFLKREFYGAAPR